LARCARVTRSRDGYSLEVTRIPLRVLVLQEILERAGGLSCRVSGHRLGCCPPDWTFRLGWGRYRPGDRGCEPDMPGWRRHSLGTGLHAAFSRAVCYGEAAGKVMLAVPLTPAQAGAFPEWSGDLAERDMREGATPLVASEPGTDAMTVRKKDWRGRGKVAL
jgi:hypothetical protein